MAHTDKKKTKKTSFIIEQDNQEYNKNVNIEFIY